MFALVAFLSTALSVSAVDYDFTYSNLQFVITSSTTAKVVGHVVTSPSGGYSIPDNANGYKVTEVGADAFINCSGITSMSIGSNVTTISNRAFYGCSQLSNVSLNSNLTTIGYAAFCYCYALKSISLPSQLTTISARAFAGSGLTSITIPASVTSISDDNPFFGCSSLTSVNVNSSNAYYTSDGGVLFDKAKTKLMCYPIAKSGTSYSVPSTVTTITDGAFRDCKLVNVTLPAGLTSIGSYTFSYCNSLTKVISQAINPPTITSDCFYSTVNNSGIQLWVPTPWAVKLYKQANYWKNFSRIYESQFYDFVADRLVYLKTTATTVKVMNPESEDESAPGADYSGVINIPRTVSYGGTTYTVTGIGFNAFAVSDVTQVIIPNTVTYIEDQAFYMCTDLRSVDIGSGVRTIGDCAFNFCEDLRYVTCRAATPPTIYELTFKLQSGSGYGLDNTKLYVPGNSLSAYQSAAYWNEFYNTYSIRSLKDALTTSSIEFTSTGSYPWMTMAAGGRVYAMSGNAGVHSSNSTLTANVNVPAGGTLSFDFMAWGEGTSYDKCIFLVDGTQKFSYGNRDNDWETYSLSLSAGTHTLTWTYSKDSSVNPKGDFFAIDNVTILENIKRGDVNGDGQVNIADVTALIDYLLNGATIPNSADFNQNGQVNIADVTELIDGLLNGDLDPSNPQNSGRWLVLFDRYGSQNWYELHLGADGVYSTTVSLSTSMFGTGTTKLYFVENSYAYGAPEVDQILFPGDNLYNPLVLGHNCYRISTGYSYVLGIKFDSNNKKYVYSYKGPAL